MTRLAEPTTNGHADGLAETDAPIRLNLGGGSSKPPGDGWITIDRVYGHEVYPLDWPDNSVDEVYASHVWEHLPKSVALDALKDWVRVLKPGGRFRIAVPGFDKLVEMYQKGTADARFMSFFFGGENDDSDHHHFLPDTPGLKREMQKAGLVGICEFEPFVEDCSRYPFSLNFQGYKPVRSEANGKSRVVAVASTGRLGFTDHYTSLLKLINAKGYDVKIAQGVFWGQMLERTLAESMDQGYDYALTLDYDTVWEESDYDRLVHLMDAHPDVVALAPLQMKRSNGGPLLHRDGGMPLSECNEEVVDVKSMHFGLTLIRLEALRAMAHPWFQAKPAPDGTWGEGRIDEDIAFWHKLREVGRVCVAPQVCVGHMEIVATWPGESMTPIYQSMGDFKEHGKPKEARR